MKTPPGLAAAALLFWGWETGLLACAAALGLVLEGTRLVRWRWTADAAAFNRLWDLTVLAGAGAGFYFYSTQSLSSAVTTWLQWLPIFLFGFTAAQACSTLTHVDRNTFLWVFRRKAPTFGDSHELNVSYPYVAACLLGASAANVRDARFYVGVCALAGYALWMERPRRVSGWTTVVLFMGAVAAGQVSHQWLQTLQTAIEYKTASWLYGFNPRDLEEQDGFTAFGGIGTLKLSRRIVMEVEAELPAKPPKLLRQTSFNRYAFGNWYGIGRSFSPVARESPTTWALLPGQSAPFSLSVACYLTGGRGLLALPLGAKRITELPVEEALANRLGVVRVAKGPEFVRYRIVYRTGSSVDGPPDRIDHEIPESDAALLAQLAEELSLDSQAPDLALRKLADFFQTKFKYSQYGQSRPMDLSEVGETPLRRFLASSRAGHCEYFATAAALLLRQAGLPTRYATGFVVADSARQGRRYLVRERHAHAWVLVYYRGAWHDFDATPLADREDSQELFYQAAADLWSWARFRFSVWRWTYEPGELMVYFFGVLAVMAGGLGWRFFHKQRWRRAQEAETAEGTPRAWPGWDSEFYLLEAQWRKRGLERQPGETCAQWVRRAANDAGFAGTAPEALIELLQLHYRYRFDPRGLSRSEREDLAERVRHWLERQGAR